MLKLQRDVLWSADPPAIHHKFNKDFIHEFSDLLCFIKPQYDSFLLPGDFNIHICSLSHVLASELLQLSSESSNLVQLIQKVTLLIQFCLLAFLCSRLKLYITAWLTTRLSFLTCLCITPLLTFTSVYFCLLCTTDASVCSVTVVASSNILNINSAPLHMIMEELTSFFNSTC